MTQLSWAKGSLLHELEGWSTDENKASWKPCCAVWSLVSSSLGLNFELFARTIRTALQPQQQLLWILQSRARLSVMLRHCCQRN